MTKERQMRIIKEADLYLARRNTLPEIAKIVGVDKSTVYRDLAELLQLVDEEKYAQVRKIMTGRKGLKYASVSGYKGIISKDRERRIIKEADLYIERKSSVQEIAEIVGVNKATVHIDLSKLLQYIDEKKYAEVRRIMDENKNLNHTYDAQDEYSISEKQKLRIIEEANLYIEHSSNVRDIAKMVGVSKSTVHKDLAELLQHIDGKKYAKVCEIMLKNKRERDVRGGESTRKKFLNVK